MPYLKTNGEVCDLECVDRGRSGIILKLNPTRVLKAPLIIHNMDASEEEKFAADCLKDDNISFLENEKATFRRLGHCEHIVEWHALRSGGIEMKYMSHGPLSRFRQYHTPSGKQLHSWICSIAAAITYAHSRNVIVVMLRLEIYLSMTTSQQNCAISQILLFFRSMSISAKKAKTALLSTRIFFSSEVWSMKQ